jgi:hypothetical protein
LLSISAPDSGALGELYANPDPSLNQQERQRRQ